MIKLYFIRRFRNSSIDFVEYPTMWSMAYYPNSTITSYNYGICMNEWSIHKIANSIGFRNLYVETLIDLVDNKFKINTWEF